MGKAAFEYTWSWRRSHCAGNTSLSAVNVGDVTQQNLGNDMDAAYLLLRPAAAKAQMKAALAGTGNETGWTGGVNLTALRMAEDRAYGYFTHLRNASAGIYGADWPGRLDMDRAASGTRHGLSKMVYWRDTRRAVGAGSLDL